MLGESVSYFETHHRRLIAPCSTALRQTLCVLQIEDKDSPPAKTLNSLKAQVMVFFIFIIFLAVQNF